MPEHVNLHSSREEKEKHFAGNGCQSSRQSPPDYFFLCCDISPFAISSDLLHAQPEPLRLSLDSSTIQCFLLPFGGHLACRGSLSKRDTSTERAGPLHSSPALLPKCVETCHPPDRSRLHIPGTLTHSLLKVLD